ncbi:MAG TPA: pyridoxamine 5'-phosphate oxidase family protein [Acidimicrobiia bacterium]|nr:pyridoxamine 5'-phosphate oxidase family protein [Acidimicrobiia bacterium]
MRTEIDPRTGLEILDRDECLALLVHSAIGRIAIVSVDGRPFVFPVNFALDGEAIVFRTDAGTKLYGARRGPVAFECDGVDSVYHTGWSVLATGNAEEVVNEAELAGLVRLPLGPWCPGPKSTWLRLRPRMLTGRRIPAHGHREPNRAEVTA